MNNGDLNERSKNQLNSILSNAKKQMAVKPPTSAQEQCMLQGQQVSHKLFQEFLGRIKLMPMRPSQAEGFDMIKDLYLEALASWSRDDILYLCALAHATILIENLRDELA